MKSSPSPESEAVDLTTLRTTTSLGVSRESTDQEVAFLSPNRLI